MQMEQPKPNQDYDGHKAWLHRVTIAALAQYRENNAYREQPGKDVTHVRMMPRNIVTA